MTLFCARKSVAHWQLAVLYDFKQYHYTITPIIANFIDKK